MNDFVSGLVLPVFLVLVVVGLILMGLCGFMVGLDVLDCRGSSKGTSIETQWTWGCYAKVDGKWIPKDYVFGKANEIRIEKKP